ncbi:MAG: family 43 glycosylhydrolase [Clostridiales bacterium]|nr:family 43 glycosylhydrolase [Clostridiales bacterium]
MKEYCNPLNLEYKFQHYAMTAHREAADPTLIYFKGRYYLFASMSAGFYYSDDLMTFQWHENREIGLYLYAPDVRQCNDYLYFSASDDKPGTLWRTKDPMSDLYEEMSTPLTLWDPNMLFDDDGRVYLYWGCGNKEPLYGIELDDSFLPIGEKKALIHANDEAHGFERVNYPDKEPDSALTIAMKEAGYFANPEGTPYIEGAYCNKWRGKYYLQYAAPGTELPTYADGVYTADHPLGPYTYQAHNPFSFKPSGFINGAGHGSTIEDAHGNLWHASTMRISVNAHFERRIGLFPAGLDEDGFLYCNQHFADYPYTLPDGQFDARELQPSYMLLSYRKKVTASSMIDGHPPQLSVNEDIRTWWCAKGSAGEWLEVDLGKAYTVHSVQLNLAEEGIPTRKEESPSYRSIDSGNELRTRYLMEGSEDGILWFVISDASQSQQDRSHDYVILKKDRAMRFIKVTATSLPYQQRFAMSGLRVFGLDCGALPESVVEAIATKPDALSVQINWEKAQGAIGYNVRYGIDEHKLYSSSLVYDRNEVLITSLNRDTRYWYCIDSFNESGITQGQVMPL